MSGRERTLFTVVIAVLALLAADYYVLSPLSDEKELLGNERDKILAGMGADQKILAERKKLLPQWSSMIATGLKGDPGEAESQVLHAVRDWARESNVTLTSIKPDRPESKVSLRELNVQATGTGGMESISKLLWKMQSAKFPLKITEMQLGTRNDNNSDLALQLKISTLYRAADEKAVKAEKSGNGGAK